MVKILKNLSEKNSLFETVIVSANDTLVKMFIKKDIKFLDISHVLLKILKNVEFMKYKNIKPQNINEIIRLSEYVRLKIRSLHI